MLTLPFNQGDQKTFTIRMILAILVNREVTSPNLSCFLLSQNQTDGGAGMYHISYLSFHRRRKFFCANQILFRWFVFCRNISREIPRTVVQTKDEKGDEIEIFRAF